LLYKSGIALAALFWLGVPASADLLVTLDQTGIGPYGTGLITAPGGGYQPGLCQNSDGSGSCVIFSGTIATENDPTDDYFLDALYITMNPSNPDGGLDVFDNTYNSSSLGNAFFLDATSNSGLLGPDNPGPTQDSYSGGIFEVDVAPDTPYGDYFGTAELQYTDQVDCLSLCTVSTNFEVVVAPEPGEFMLAVSGLAAIGLLRRRLA